MLAADPPDADLQEAEFTDAFRCGVVGDVRQEIVDQLAGLGACTVSEIRGIAIAGARKGWVVVPFFDRWT